MALNCGHEVKKSNVSHLKRLYLRPIARNEISLFDFVVNIHLVQYVWNVPTSEL